MPEGETLSDAQLLEELRSFFARNPQFALAPQEGPAPGDGREDEADGDQGPETVPDPLVPPGWLVTAAKDVFELRGIDARIAELTWDSFVGAGPVRMRSAGTVRMLSFETLDLTIDLEITSNAGDHEIVGHVIPPAADRVEVNWLPVGEDPSDAPSGAGAGAGTGDVRERGPAGATVDPTGKFVLAGLRPGRIRLVFHREGQADVRTAWFRPG